MSSWRFDQGRLDYFRFDEIRQLARALTEIDGIDKPEVGNDVLRSVLGKYSDRPFLPSNYTVWRNYKRVFGCLLLAVDLDNRIVCTDVCKSLAHNTLDYNVDDYLRHFATRYYYPAPMFQRYNISDIQLFPVIALLKLLVSNYLTKRKSSLSMYEISTYLIANRVTGLEPLEHYATLTPKRFSGELRQARELVIFISQLSFLKWDNPSIYLEIMDDKSALEIIECFQPKVQLRHVFPEAEILNMGSDFTTIETSNILSSQQFHNDIGFTEGRKTRVTHIRTERSAKLREFYFSTKKNSHICDMCKMNTALRYPWTERIIELHHLLPLASPIRVERNRTSIADIVGVCPTCHRATHKFYDLWLKENQLDDFTSYNQARTIYENAKKAVAIK